MTTRRWMISLLAVLLCLSTMAAPANARGKSPRSSSTVVWVTAKAPRGASFILTGSMGTFSWGAGSDLASRLALAGSGEETLQLLVPADLTVTRIDVEGAEVTSLDISAGQVTFQVPAKQSPTVTFMVGKHPG